MGDKKTYMWMGGGQVIEPQTDASTSSADIIQMIPATPLTALAGARTKFLIEAIYLNFSIHRLLSTTFDALGFLVYQIPPQEDNNNPALVLDALSTEDRLYARKNIMMMAPLPVPPILGTSDLLAFTPNDAILVDHHEYQANRKHDTTSQILCLAVNSDVSVVTRVFCQWRILTSWS